MGQEMAVIEKDSSFTTHSSQEKGAHQARMGCPGMPRALSGGRGAWELWARAYIVVSEGKNA